MNFDGFIYANFARVGVVIYNHYERILKAFPVFILISSLPMAELFVTLYGLKAT